MTYRMMGQARPNFPPNQPTANYPGPQPIMQQQQQMPYLKLNPQQVTKDCPCFYTSMSQFGIHMSTMLAILCNSSVLDLEMWPTLRCL